MFRNILVPLDMSARNDHGLEVAAELCEPGGNVILLHVVQTIPDVPFEELADFYQGLQRRAGESLDAKLAALGDRGCRLRREVSLGRRGPEIARFAAENDVDLIVMMSHPIDPKDPSHHLGTISQQAALLADCSVLLVRAARDR